MMMMMNTTTTTTTTTTTATVLGWYFLFALVYICKLVSVPSNAYLLTQFSCWGLPRVTDSLQHQCIQYIYQLARDSGR